MVHFKSFEELAQHVVFCFLPSLDFGVLLGVVHPANIVEFKDILLTEKDRFARAFAAHLLAFATGREVGVEDRLALSDVVRKSAASNYRFQSLIKLVIMSESFRR